MQPSDSVNESFELEVLLVEDNPGDVVLFKQALRNSLISYSLTVAADGAQAVQILKGRNALNPQYRPHVVFLDLNLPCRNGAEVLAEIKGDSAISAIPVAMLTGSDDPEDQAVCTRLGADAYFRKAVTLEDFLILAAKIQAFLVNLNAVPGADSAQTQCPTVSAA